MLYVNHHVFANLGLPGECRCDLHFISTEVLTFAALLLVRFDFRPMIGSWAEPRKDLLMNTAFPCAKDRVLIELTPKNNMKWEVIISDTSKGDDVVKEDCQKCEQ